MNVRLRLIQHSGCSFVVNDGAMGGGDANIRTASSDKLSLEVYPGAVSCFLKWGCHAISLLFLILPIKYTWKNDGFRLIAQFIVGVGRILQSTLLPKTRNAKFAF